MNHFSNPIDPQKKINLDNFIRETEIINLREKIAGLPSSARFGDDQIETIYGLGYSLFEQGKIDNACGIFQLLLVYKPLEVRFLTAFGICCKLMARYDGAIPAFSSALIVDPTNLVSGVHLAECFVALNLRDQALLVLQPLLKLAELDIDHVHVLRRAQTLHGLLEISEDQVV